MIDEKVICPYIAPESCSFKYFPETMSEDVATTSAPTSLPASDEKINSPGEDMDSKLAPAENFWSVSPNGAVKLRIGATKYDSDEPITVHEVFKRTVEKSGIAFALAVKRDGEWEKWTYKRYMQECRTAAKGFIKVNNNCDLSHSPFLTLN